MYLRLWPSHGDGGACRYRVGVIVRVSGDVRSRRLTAKGWLAQWAVIHRLWGAIRYPSGPRLNGASSGIVEVRILFDYPELCD